MIDWILGGILVASSLGVILAKKPVYSCLFFLLTLLTLAGFYLQLHAPFISVMQVLVYAGAILVIFMFVIVLFQDAYLAIEEFKAQSRPGFLLACGFAFLLTLTLLAARLAVPGAQKELPEGYGSVQSLGHALYIDFFFPFEAVALLFLVAIVGALYIGKKTWN